MGYVTAWVCIGLAAALAACIWPFRRGALGIAINVTAGVAGAVAGPLIAVVLGLPRADPRTLPLSMLGALALLGMAHLLWKWLHPGGLLAHRRESKPRA